jgi:hypothetical protein
MLPTLCFPGVAARLLRDYAGEIDGGIALTRDFIDTRRGFAETGT